MALRYKNICHTYGSQTVLDGVDLIAKPGEITCLLGPSGGGKSTLLHLAAGLEPLQKGEIWLDDQLFASPGNEPAPEKRPIGLMFQDNALFPNMTVESNILFGFGRRPSKKHKRIAHELLANVGLDTYAKRFPHTLSGGQQQRVALARALAPQPKVLLMDEPYASIDVTRRRVLREAARLTLRNSQTSTILVTHDPAEAMEMADQIAILDHGQVVQQGTPQELFEHPANATVAGMFGDAQTFAATRTEAGLLTEYGVIGDKKLNRINHYEKDQVITVVARPTGIKLTPIAEATAHSSLRIEDLRYVGHQWIAFLKPITKTATMQLRVALTDITPFEIGTCVSIDAQTDDFFLFQN